MGSASGEMLDNKVLCFQNGKSTEKSLKFKSTGIKTFLRAMQVNTRISLKRGYGGRGQRDTVQLVFCNYKPHRALSFYTPSMRNTCKLYN